MAARLVLLTPDRALPGAGAGLEGLRKELLEPQVQPFLVPRLGDAVPLILKSQELVMRPDFHNLKNPQFHYWLRTAYVAREQLYS